jgi:ABC-2 type transport system permease protein
MTTTALTRPSGDLRVTLPRVLRMEWIKFWSLRSTI